MTPYSCSFVIPAYNEATRLAPTLRVIAELSASHLGECQIIVVDDGSTDSTADIARAFHAPLIVMSAFYVFPTVEKDLLSVTV